MVICVEIKRRKKRATGDEKKAWRSLNIHVYQAEREITPSNRFIWRKTMPDSHEILHFSLEGVLEPQYYLAVNRTEKGGFIALLATRGERPSLEASVFLTLGELCIFLPLLESYPYYCSYAFLLASLYGPATEEGIAQAKELLEDALDEGVWDSVMRPVRNVLSRTRLKTHTLGITILSIIETGYSLGKYRRRSVSQSSK
jgi:hypothetical protein